MQRTIEYTLSTQYNIIPAGDDFEEKAIQRTLDEILANWHDQVIQGCEGAHVMEVGEHLRVSTPGTVMSLSDTIFGGGTEAEGNIGMFHEGVGVAMVLTTQLKKRGTDLNFRIQVVTEDNTTTWTFDTGHSDTFGCEVLKVQETIGDSEETFLPRGVHYMLETRGYFDPTDYLFLILNSSKTTNFGYTHVWEYHDPTGIAVDAAHLEGEGTFLLNGRGVFFQGIRQRGIQGYQHGYNITSPELKSLGRDRQLNSLSQCRLIQDIFAHAAEKGAITPKGIWAMYDVASPPECPSEVNTLDEYGRSRDRLGEVVNKIWVEDHPGMYPTNDIGRNRVEYAQVGITSEYVVEVPFPLLTLLERGQSAGDRIAERTNSIEEQWEWSDLFHHERERLTTAVAQCNETLNAVLPGMGEEVYSLSDPEGWSFVRYTYNDTRGYHGFSGRDVVFSRSIIDPKNPKFWELLMNFMVQAGSYHTTRQELWSHLFIITGRGGE